jgi:hypothetical protein
MPAVSLRKCLNQVTSDVIVHTFGLRALLNPFYARRPGIWPHGSISTVCDALTWPEFQRSYGYTAQNGDYPKDRSANILSRCQGVTHDDLYWYFSTAERLYRFPVDVDLNKITDNESLHFGAIPANLSGEGYDHLGALCFHQDPGDKNGYLYVPLEHTNKEKPSHLLVYDRDQNFICSTPFAVQGADGPWCAVHPANGYVYSSAFGDDTSHDPFSMFVYERQLVRNRWGDITDIHLRFVDRFPLYDEDGAPVTLNNVQGGAFSPLPHCHLYLSVDVDGGGLMGFDTVTGRRTIHTDVECHRTKNIGPKTVQWQELEGLTVWNLDGRNAPGIQGQLHLVMTEHNDVWFFKHFEAGGNAF